MALIAKRSGYVVDNEIDSGHAYSGAVIHFFPSVIDPTEIKFDIIGFELDLKLAKDWC